MRLKLLTPIEVLVRLPGSTPKDPKGVRCPATGMAALFRHVGHTPDGRVSAS